MTRFVKAIFFDLGETLVTQNIEDSMVTRKALLEISTLLPVHASPAALFKIYQKGYRVNDAIRSEYNVEIPIRVWMRQLLNRAIGPNVPEYLLSRSVRVVIKKRAANALPFEDARPTLRRLAKTRVKLGIISNVSSHDVAIAILRKVRLEKYFHSIVTSAECGVRKPDPGIFRYALYRLRIRPKDAVVVGDSERHDIQGGRISGLRTLLVNRKSSLGEFSSADFKFETLADAAETLESL